MILGSQTHGFQLRISHNVGIRLLLQIRLVDYTQVNKLEAERKKQTYTLWQRGVLRDSGAFFPLWFRSAPVWPSPCPQYSSTDY